MARGGRIRKRGTSNTSRMEKCKGGRKKNTSMAAADGAEDKLRMQKPEWKKKKEGMTWGLKENKLWSKNLCFPVEEAPVYPPQASPRIL